MSESQKSSVCIREISDEILEKIILSCYPHQSITINSKPELYELLLRADQFQMPALKSTLLELFCSSLIRDKQDPDELLSVLTKLNITCASEKRFVARWLVMNWDYSGIEKLVQPFLSFFSDYFDLTQFPECQ